MPLSSAEIDAQIATLPSWQVVMQGERRAIERRWKLADYAQALSLVNRISALAEAANHHPDIRFGWGYVAVMLTTHDAQGVTQKDVALAHDIEKL